MLDTPVGYPELTGDREPALRGFSAPTDERPKTSTTWSECELWSKGTWADAGTGCKHGAGMVLQARPVRLPALFALSSPAKLIGGEVDAQGTVGLKHDCGRR